MPKVCQGLATTTINLQKTQFKHNSKSRLFLQVAKGIVTAEPGEKATVIIHAVDHQDKPYTIPLESIACELVSENNEKSKCTTRVAETNCYEVSQLPAYHMRKVQAAHQGGG